MDTAHFFDIQNLTFDPELQVRVRINDEQVAQYAECMTTEEDTKVFPPVEIFYDGVKYWLADGHHRRAAAEKAGHSKIWAIIKSGTHEDAVWAAISGNGKQGLALTAEDRKRALEIALRRWPKKSNRVIAEAVGCSRDTVRRQRGDVSGGADAPPEKREGKDGKSYSSKQKTKNQTSKEESSKAEPDESALEFDLEPKHTDVIPNDNGDYYPPLSQPIPEKYSQFEQSVKLQNISLKNPEGLIACLFDLFERPYREKLILDLLSKMETDDGKKTVQRIMMKLNKKFPN